MWRGVRVALVGGGQDNIEELQLLWAHCNRVKGYLEQVAGVGDWSVNKYHISGTRAADNSPRFLMSAFPARGTR